MNTKKRAVTSYVTNEIKACFFAVRRFLIIPLSNDNSNLLAGTRSQKIESSRVKYQNTNLKTKSSRLESNRIDSSIRSVVVLLQKLCRSFKKNYSMYDNLNDLFE